MKSNTFIIRAASRVKTGIPGRMSFQVQDDDGRLGKYFRGDEEDSIYRIILVRRSPIRSRSQGAYLNKGIRIMSGELGFSFEEMKDNIKREAISAGYPVIKDKSGEYVLDKHDCPVGISEADATVAQCNILIETMQRIAAEHNILLMEDEYGK